MPNTIDSLIESLIRILNKDSEDMAQVIEILNSREIYTLRNLFNNCDTPLLSKNELQEILIKINSITTLTYVIQNNEKIKNSVERVNGKKNNNKNILKILYEILFELYKVYFEINKYSDNYDKIFNLAMIALSSVASDKITISDIIIRNYYLDFFQSLSGEEDSIFTFESYVHLAIIKLICTIRKEKDIEDLDNIFNLAEKKLESIQKLELSRAELNIDNAMIINCYANILYVCNNIKHYMLTGNLQVKEQWNLYAFIETYSFNIIKLVENIQSSKLRAISNILKYSLEQICKNSIWSITGKSPAIKQFFNNCLKSKEHLIYTLLPSQRDSIVDLLTTKKSIVINMPTSSGKSLLAELYIIYILHNFYQEEPTVCYIVPTNALINQVYRKLKEDLKEFNYRVETVIPSNETDEIENEILNMSHIDVLISTPEKLDFLIRKDHPCIKNLKLVVLDEAHNISDDNRGSKFELLLATVKQMKNDVNFLLLSPFIKNSKEIALWLGDTENESAAITLNWSPTKQYVGCNLLKQNDSKSVVLYMPTDRNYIVKEPIETDLELNPRIIKTQLGEKSINYKVKNIILIEKYIRLGTVMVLCEGAGTSRNLALKSLSYFKTKGILKDISDEPEIKKAIELIKLESTEEDSLIECIKYGIAFHHSKLSALVKECIEILISKNLIKLICATTTLAQGMNFPITTVIFDTLIVGGGRESKKLNGSEFWNIAGRAGRAYMDKEGHIIIPYQGSQKETKEITVKYIKYSLNEVVSSLNDFFEKYNEEFKFDYEFIKNNPAVSNFLQYLNHIINISYDYKLENIDINKIRNILNHSLVYKEISFKEGFIESQQKISDFAYQYINHLKGINKGQLKLADLFGISDISFRNFNNLIRQYIQEVSIIHNVNDKDDYIKASKIILESKDVLKLAPIIEKISRIPEIKLSVFGYGNFNSENVAKIVIGWVNGDRVYDIAKNIQYEGHDFEEVFGKCQQYVNGNLRSFMPWGMSMYQTLVEDLDSEDAKNLSSYIYYGVNDKESVILSKAGVPRFAVKMIKNIFNTKYSDVNINIRNIEIIKETIKNINENEYTTTYENKKVIKDIIIDHLV